MSHEADIVGERRFLLCNEAIARGALEAGVHVVTAYPGTPSSEITDNLARMAKKTEMNVEYSTNEIVALETAAGAAMCGVRSMTVMKHVGLNVASDAFITLAYTGVRGGMLVITADDPNCHSSQNEQDNRYYALLANVPCLEPTNAQEAKDMLLYGFEVSEQLELPILLRLVTRVAHSRGPVVLSPIVKEKRKGRFTKDVKRFVTIPAHSRIQHGVLLEKMSKAKEISEKSSFNCVEGQGEIGVITSGVSYNYVKEALHLLKSDAPILKIGMSYPLPERLIKSFLGRLKAAVVVEELEPILESQLKSIAYDHGLRVPLWGKSQGYFPRTGEISTRIVLSTLSRIMGRSSHVDYKRCDSVAASSEKLVPGRPPVLCSGCPHTATLYAIKIATGGRGVYPTDIGCYTLGCNPPLQIGDALLCMGSSAGLPSGMSMVLDTPIVSVVGDSTFFHASIPGLINAVYNGHKFVYVVLDNLTTAMTGFQPHPGTGVKADGKPTKRVLIEEVARGCGVEFVEVVDPYNLKQTISTIKKALQHEGPSIVVSRQSCTSLKGVDKRGQPFRILPERCIFKSLVINGTRREICMLCSRSLGCPSIIIKNNKLTIDEMTCVGCGVCAQICPSNAIAGTES